MKYQFFALIVVSFLLGACTETMVMIPEISNECTEKVILVEELTGVSCPNCPKGTEAVEDILALFPGTVIVVGVHGDFLCEPKSDSKYDFRSEPAKAVEDFLQPWLGKPAATVDRFPFVDLPDGEIALINPNSWLSRVEQRCQTPQALDIQIDSNYDEESRQATITVTTTGMVPIEGELRMNLFITESHLIDPQDAGGLGQGIISDYEHNHVLKDMLSELTGDFLVNNLSIDQSVTKTYTYEMPAESNGEWLLDNMEVVAFITEGGQTRGPVLHAAITHMD